MLLMVNTQRQLKHFLLAFRNISHRQPRCRVLQMNDTKIDLFNFLKHNKGALKRMGAPLLCLKKLNKSIFVLFICKTAVQILQQYLICWIAAGRQSHSILCAWSNCLATHRRWYR